jgi:hypothetical protein
MLCIQNITEEEKHHIQQSSASHFNQDFYFWAKIGRGSPLAKFDSGHGAVVLSITFYKIVCQIAMPFSLYSTSFNSSIPT